MKLDKYFSFFLLVSFGLILLILVAQSTKIALGQTGTIPIISTRNHFDRDTGELQSGQTPTGYDAINIPGLQAGTACPPEIAIYTHGIWVGVGSNSLEAPTEIFDRARMSLADLDYQIPLIGFSWDSDTDISPYGWETAKIIAKGNGPKLAQFIFDLKDKCPDTDVRLIAHSLGARVVLSSLDSLTNNPNWNNNNYTITSVHLMGGAVDDDEVSKNANDVTSSGGIKSAYGKAIEEEVVNFYNLFNLEDDVLEPGDVYPLYFDCFNYSEYQPVYYPCFEQDFALGQNGAQLGIDIPENYHQINAGYQIDFIIDADGDGFCDLSIPFTTICTIDSAGDNHFGYVGFRYPFSGPFVGILRDNGAMNIVVDNWNNPTQ